MTTMSETERLELEQEMDRAEKHLIDELTAEVQRLRSLVNGGIHSEREARVEIERLQAEMEVAKKAFDISVAENVRLQAEIRDGKAQSKEAIKELRAEIKRLSAANEMLKTERDRAALEHKS